MHVNTPGGNLLGDVLLQPRLDMLALGKSPVEIHLADNGAQRGHDQILDRILIVLDFIDGAGRIGDLDEGDGVGDNDGIILCDDLLGSDREDITLG